MIDSSIAMGYQPIKLENPMNQLANLMKIRADQSTYDVGQQGLQETNRLNDLYRSSLGADGKIDRTKLYTGAAQQGLGSKIPGLQKGFLEADEAQGKVDKQNIEILEKNLSLFRSVVPQVKSPEEAAAYAKAMYEHPVLGKFAQQFGSLDDVMRKNAEMYAKDPRGWVVGSSGVTGDKLVDMLRGTRQNTNLGGVSRGETINAYGEIVPGQTTTTQITQSPDSIASNATQIRGQNMVDARSREATAATMSKPFEVTGPDGSPVLVQQNKQGQIVPVTGYSPKTAADKPLTDAQSKAALFGSRMQAANQVLDSLATDGTTTSIPGARTGFGVGAVLNTVSSAKQQQLNQAKRDFVNAVLRRESGAVIADSEFANADQQYFPQVGDSKEVIAQKKANREIAIRGIQAEVPKGQRKVINEIIGGNPIDSLLDKYK